MDETYYEVLGVADTASSAEIRTAYRKLALLLHPDREGSAALFRRVNAAYAVLADPARRAAYDGFLATAGPGEVEFARWERLSGGGDAAPCRAEEPRPGPAGRSARASGNRPRFVWCVLGGGYLSVIGFWLLQVVWFIDDGTFEDGLFDEFPWMSGSSWIIALAGALTLVLARPPREGGRVPTEAVGVAGCSAVVFIAFLVGGVFSDEPGVWPAALGALVAAVGAVALLAAPSDSG